MNHWLSKRWHTTNDRCPLCSEAGQEGDSLIELKGIDDFTALFTAEERAHNSPVVHTIETNDSGDDFEDLPPFRCTLHKVSN